MAAQLSEGYHGVRRLLSRDSQKTGNPVATVPPGSRDPIDEASLLSGYGTWDHATVDYTENGIFT